MVGSAAGAASLLSRCRSRRSCARSHRGRRGAAFAAVHVDTVAVIDVTSVLVLVDPAQRLQVRGERVGGLTRAGRAPRPPWGRWAVYAGAVSAWGRAFRANGTFEVHGRMFVLWQARRGLTVYDAVRDV